MAWPVRKTTRLPFGRISEPGLRYFITLTTKDRAAALVAPDTASVIADSFQGLHQSGDIELHAATVMSDHVHFLFTLGLRLNVGQVMGKLKTLAREHGRAAWRWQKNGFEHQVRSQESLEDYAFYIFMNPYRAGLCPLTSRWPWWICPQPSVFRFLDSVQEGGSVPPAWLGLCDQIAANIVTGEE